MVKHDVAVRGITIAGGFAPRPVLAGMPDADFPARFFGDLGKDRAFRTSGAAEVARRSNGYAHLLQPVQRTVQVALVDAACQTVGTPRLDPRKIESAGLVIRRIPVEARTGAHQHDQTCEAWMQSADGRFAWVRLKKSDEDLDPDPVRRPALFSGQAELDRLLTAHQKPLALTESFSPAFVAPPDICERLARTIVFGVIQTASSEVSNQPPPGLDYSDGSLKKQLPPLILAGSHRAPYAGRFVTNQYMSADFARDHGADDFLIFAKLLQVVAVQLDAFSGTPQATALLNALNRRSVKFRNGSRMKVGDFLARANSYLLDDGKRGQSLELPTEWDSSTADDERAVIAAAQTAVQIRAAAVIAPEGRFQDHTRLYKLRVFLRVPGHDHCPPTTIWSEYSDPFEIAPWYETGGTIGPPVPLPKPTTAFLKAAKPNVSFVVPDSLMNAMDASSLKSQSAGGGLDITWICGFNIPIITICAFFVLNIFLTLLNIVFFWLPFVKICIPIPTSLVPKVGGES